jgi:P-type Cu+ transporter
MFTLVAVGTGVAWTYSTVAVLAPGLFPAASHAMDGTVEIYFESAAAITVLVLLSVPASFFRTPSGAKR